VKKERQKEAEVRLARLETCQCGTSEMLSSNTINIDTAENISLRMPAMVHKSV
jgi:hypothetical protein